MHILKRNQKKRLLRYKRQVSCRTLTGPLSPMGPETGALLAVRL